MPSLIFTAIAPPLMSAALAVPGVPPPTGPAPLAIAAWRLQDEGAPPPETAGGAPPEDSGEIVVQGTYGPPEGDPVEQLNAEVYRLGAAVDEAMIEPVAYAYRDGVPEPIRDGLGNVVQNLAEPGNALNFLLQGKVGKAFGALGRLAINSTLGIGGLIDVAGKPGIGIPYRDNGFANTMGFYGIGPGACLYLPGTGATSVRDAVGGVLDQSLLPFVVGKPFNQIEYAGTYFVVNGLDQRLKFDAELAAIRASEDPYAERRETYLAQRAREIAALRGELPPEPPPAPETGKEAPGGSSGHPATDEPPAGESQAGEPQAGGGDLPPRALVEQIQLTARSSPASR